MNWPALVDIEAIVAAEKRIRPAAIRTPLVPAAFGESHRPLWLKLENLQPIGVFKIRGAYNALAVLDDATLAHGVVAYSSGNHAQAVAYAAREFGIPATIVINESAPKTKIAKTREYGADVVTVAAAEREKAAAEIVRKTGATLIAPFDDPAVIAGQGTIGIELAEQLPDVDNVLVPVSGGGLISGIAIAIKSLCPKAKVFGVEPKLAADAGAGFAARRPVHWPARDRARTIADGLRAEPSELTFAHLMAAVDGMITVEDDAILSAIRLLATTSKIIAEPSGAATVATYLNDNSEIPEGNTVAVISGGNIDPNLLVECLTDKAEKERRK